MNYEHILTEFNKTVENEHGLCRCGCGMKTEIATMSDSRTGHVKGKPFMWIAGHRAKAGNKIKVDEPVGCWNWATRPYSNGYCYGRDGNGKRMLAHRMVWIRANGPVPQGLELDHVCRNKRCVNPEHLRAVTRSVNVKAACDARRGEMLHVGLR